MQHYLAVIAEKTGSLIATSGRFGGMFSGCPPEHVEALRRFGATIGTAFQISDDVIDIASPSDSSGKTPGTDLREGVHTLPMLYAMQESGADAERLRVLLARPITDDAEVAKRSTCCAPAAAWAGPATTSPARRAPPAPSWRSSRSARPPRRWPR